MSTTIHKPAPDFKLRDLKGRELLLSQYRAKIVIVNFWSCECPHSERVDLTILEKLKSWGSRVALIPIASNRNESVEALDQVARSRGLPQILIDPQHRIADLYDAQTTPHVFLIDQEGILRYRGAVDDVTFRQKSATRNYLNEAVESLLAGRLPAITEAPAYGCAIIREI